MRVHTLYFKKESQAEWAKRVVQACKSEVGTLDGEPVLQFLTEESLEQTKRSQIDFATGSVRSVFNRVVEG